VGAALSDRLTISVSIVPALGGSGSTMMSKNESTAKLTAKSGSPNRPTPAPFLTAFTVDSADVQIEVEKHLGRSFIDHSRKHPPRGKPPLSGWEREKLRRQRQNGTA
jgi:hypothetical protein